MKEIDKALKNFDKQVDRTFKKSSTHFLKKYFFIFSSITLLGLLIIFVFKTHHSKPYLVASLVRDDIKKVTQILSRIDKECNILSIKTDRVILDFFTVKDFSGSEIGGMNLAYPKKWQGPYLDKNPTLQGHYYEILRGKDGYFIAPGRGVKLPNGYVVGKDFTTSRYVKLGSMLEPEGYFFFQGVLLATKVPFKIGDWDSPIKRIPQKKIEAVSEALDEFNQAIPFAHSLFYETSINSNSSTYENAKQVLTV